MTQGPKGIRAPAPLSVRPGPPADILGFAVFNKEKRQKDKAVKEELKELIKPRPTFEEKQAARARRLNRDAIVEDRNTVVADRIRALHAGAGDDPNIARFGGDLLYLEGLSGIQVMIQDQFLYTPPKEATHCCARWQVHGTHDKEFLGMAPTGRTVTFGGASICSVTNENEITQEYHYWDMVTLLQQIQAP